MSVVRAVTGVLTIAVVGVLIASSVSAENYGGGSVQGYDASVPIDSGTIVQLADKSTDQVKAAEKSQRQNMFGVTVDRSQIPLTISNGSRKNEVFVAVSGTYNVLVSTEAGPIAAGDYITLSSLKGVAMNAGTEKDTVLGRANSSFDGTGTTLGSTTLKDSAGKSNQKVTLGSVPVTINIQRNPNEKSTEV